MERPCVHADRKPRAEGRSQAAGAVMKPMKPRDKGELGKPIYVGSIPFEAANEEQQGRIEQGIEQAAINKLPLLMEHYKIPNEDDYFSLALALAKDWVPGFQ